MVYMSADDSSSFPRTSMWSTYVWLHFLVHLALVPSELVMCWISNVLYATTMQMSTSRQFSQIIFGSTLFKANWWWISNDAPLLRLSSHQMLNVACVPVFLMLHVTYLVVWCFTTKAQTFHAATFGGCNRAKLSSTCHSFCLKFQTRSASGTYPACQRMNYISSGKWL